MVDIHDAIGLLGISLSIYCYARAQWKHDFTRSVIYYGLNLSSALLLGLSLVHDWNLASFASNTIWGIISLYGLVRSLKPLSRWYPRFLRDVTKRPGGRRGMV